MVKIIEISVSPYRKLDLDQITGQLSWNNGRGYTARIHCDFDKFLGIVQKLTANSVPFTMEVIE